ncbi:MAG TPA: LON peptidase substrate-binding domain-containing protein [Anaerolineae bacterium]
MDENTEAIELPLFPLNTVLFPGQMLPLHIFEDRYQHMIRHCLAEALPFGVVLLRKGREVDDPSAEPYSVGTMAEIVESTHLPDGSLNIVTMGTERFRIRRLLHDQPYLRGEVDNYPLPDTDGEGSLEGLTEVVARGVARYIKLIAEAAGLHIKVEEMPETARQVGFLAAVAMQIDNTEKQTLLDSRSLRDILIAEVTLLKRENALLAWMASSKDWPQEVQSGVSGTLLPN